MALTLVVPQAAPAHTGTVAGKITTAEGSKLAKPAQVILLSPDYVEQWNTDVQERMDNYWERFKPTFIQQKEMYREVAKMAYRDAFDALVRSMRRSSQPHVADFIHDTTADGKFEFTHIPVGRYKLLAMGPVGFEQIVWQESVDLTGSVPLYVELKKTLP
jgi:hypothetical protein